MKKIWEKWQSFSLVLRILAGLAIGLILAFACPGASAIGVLGKIFVSALKAMAPILVALLVMSSVARANAGHGALFRDIIVIYLSTTLLAACIAVAASFLFPVGIPLSEAAEGSAPAGLGDMFGNLLTSVVSNPIAAVADANYLSILFWAVVIGLGLKAMKLDTAVKVLSEFASACSEVVRWIIQFAPFGVLGLVFTAVSESGMGIFADYGKLLLLLVGCMLVTALVVNPAIVALLIRKNPYPLVWKCLKDSGLSAFFTRSSAANIPVNMDLCRRMGVDEEFYSVSIPLGSTVNMNGAAVTITVMSLAVCHTLGVEVALGPALILSFVAALSACGASGVAGGSLLLIPLACSLFGIDNDTAMQAVAIGFIIGIIQDSVETALNSSADALFTIAVDRRHKMADKK